MAPPNDLALFVLDAVGELDLAPIYARYRAVGWGAPAFEPATMTALLLPQNAIRPALSGNALLRQSAE